jgi:plastocyanin
MNDRIKVAVIGLVSVGLFAALVYYGWTYRHGSPQTYEVKDARVLAVPFQPKPLPLDPADAAWQDVPGLDVDLMPQMTQQPWTTGRTPAVRVQALHDGGDIYFRLTWQDDTPNRTLSVDSFADGCAVAVPLDPVAPVRSIMMGFSSPVNIWHWQAHKGTQAQQDTAACPPAPPDYAYPFEDRETLPISKTPADLAVRDLLAQRPGSLTPKARQIVQGEGQWDRGTWAVVLKRSLRTQDAEQDSQFPWGRCRASFAVWDGDQGDRGARKSMSEWVLLDIQAATRPAPAAARKESEKVGKSQEGEKVRRSDSGKTLRPSHVLTFSPSLVPGLLASVTIPHLASVSPAEPEPKVIEVVAQRFHYTPSRISVKKGQRVTLCLESLDVTHGLYLDGYGIDIKARPGQAGKAMFTAERTGRFTFRCSETCGEFHPYMVGFLEVTPNRRFHVFVAAVAVAFVVVLGALGRAARGQKGDGT